MDAIPRTINIDDWITPVFGGILLVLAILKSRQTDRFYNFLRILATDKFFRESHKNPKTLFDAFTKSLFVVQAIVFSLVIHLMLVQWKVLEDMSFLVYLQILLLYMVFVVGKYLIERMLGVLFSLEEVLREYVFFKISSKNFMALVIIPFLLLIVYTLPQNIFLHQVLILLWLLLNIVFLGYYYYKNSKLISGNLYYIILYLCTFEIAPYYLLFKVFMKANYVA